LRNRSGTLFSLRTAVAAVLASLWTVHPATVSAQAAPVLPAPAAPAPTPSAPPAILIEPVAATAAAAHPVDLPEAIARIKPSIVSVGSYEQTANPPFKAHGTGFAVGDGLSIITNAHVLPRILETATKERLAILTGSGGTGGMRLRFAQVAAVDPEHDVAVLRIEGSPLPPLPIRADRQSVQEGQSIAFTGYALGQTLGLTATTHRGIVSAVTTVALPAPNSRMLNPAAAKRLRSGPFEVFQLDATAYPGHSGSPLYDPRSMEVVGVVNMVGIKGSRETAISQPTGISYAIPISYAAELLAAPSVPKQP
jgi:serine protease Do